MEETTTTTMTNPSPPAVVSPFFLGATARPVVASHAERVFDVAWSEDGRLLASASEANEVRLWAAPADDGPRADDPPSLLGAPLAHEAEVLRVGWRGSELLASATATGRVRLWAVGAGAGACEGEGEGALDVRLTTEFAHRQEGQVYALKWVGPRHEEDAAGGGAGGGGGSELMTAMDDAVFFWDLERGGGPSVAARWEFQQLPGADSFGGAARNPDRTSYIFDAAVGPLCAQQGACPVVCLALSDGSVRIHDRRSARAVATLRGSASAHLTSLCLATEEGLLVASGGRGEATVYDTRTFGVRCVLQGHARPCFGAHIVPREVAARAHNQLAAARLHGKQASAPPPLPLLMTWSSDSTLALHELGSIPSAPTNGERTAASLPPPLPPPPLPRRPVAITPHPDFPVFCAAFSPASAGRPVRLVLGGGRGQQHGHTEHGSHQGCTHDHDHDHQDHDHEEGCGTKGAGSRTLLSYVFG